MKSSNTQILVGKIVAAQGIHGEVRIQTFTAQPLDFEKLSVFGDNIPNKAVHFVRPVPNSTVIIAKIDGINDRTDAENLRGTKLYINRDDLPPLSPGEYYQADLVGMDVMRGDNMLGHVVCFQNFGAGDIMELDNGDMVSFLGAIVDFNKKIITIK